jgi:hypothetical protein
MTCPECGGKGHHPTERRTVKHGYDRCDDPTAHDSEGGYGTPEYHWHYVDCIRCGRAGTVTPPEVLLSRLVALMTAPTKRGGRGAP